MSPDQINPGQWIDDLEEDERIERMREIEAEYRRECREDDARERGEGWPRAYKGGE
jgi:hypothetical protein